MILRARIARLRIEQVAMRQQSLHQFQVRLDLLEQFRLLHQLGDAAAPNEFLLHHFLD